MIKKPTELIVQIHFNLQNHPHFPLREKTGQISNYNLLVYGWVYMTIIIVYMTIDATLKTSHCLKAMMLPGCLWPDHSSLVTLKLWPLASYRNRKIF